MGMKSTYARYLPHQIGAALLTQQLRTDEQPSVVFAPHSRTQLNTFFLQRAEHQLLQFLNLLWNPQTELKPSQMVVGWIRL